MQPGMVLVEYFRTADRLMAAVLTEQPARDHSGDDRATNPATARAPAVSAREVPPCRPNTSGESRMWRCRQRRRTFGSCTPNCSRRLTFLPVVISSSCRTICCTTCLFMRCMTGNGMSSTRTPSPTRRARPFTGSVVSVRSPPPERRSFSASRTSARPPSSKKSRRLRACCRIRSCGLARPRPRRPCAELGSTSRIIHIATHGYFREDNPLFSGIRLGDSYLTLYDLYSLRLPAELVTVSGCGTGLNVVTAGDELGGLIRGLFSAGARSLLVTLWDVHDRSTAEFVKSFYRNLWRRRRQGAARCRTPCSRSARTTRIPTTGRHSSSSALQAETSPPSFPDIFSCPYINGVPSCPLYVYQRAT